MPPTGSKSPSVFIDVDEKSNSALSHRPSVKSYATRVFQESTVGIVSSIFTTNGKCRRFFKVFLSSLCIAGFIYHCVSFLNHVLGYPEIVNIVLNKSLSYDWPAYTFCSNNPINRNIFCALLPEHCVEPSVEFCKKYSSYCGANTTLVPKKIYYDRLPVEFQLKWILEFQNFTNVLNIERSFIRRHAEWEETDEISGPYLRAPDFGSGLLACYRIHSLVENSQRPLQKDLQYQYLHLDEILRFYLSETEMMNPRINPGVYFCVHSPFEFGYPLEKGIFLRGGRTYRIYVERKEEVLLKAPFESNCLDYNELWEKNNRTGPRSKKMCQEKCELEFTILKYQCSSYYNMYPYKEEICTDEELYNRTVTYLMWERAWTFYYNCLKNCRDECRSLTYMAEISEQDQIKLHYEDDEEEINRHIEVGIYLSNEEAKVLTHSPKYETVDVISSIGGFMGCWLGIALLDILDVFGSIFTVCRYAFRKRSAKEN